MKLSSIALVVAVLVFCVMAESISRAKDLWQRVYTGDDSIIELNTATLRFEPGHVLGAEFRTSFSKSESVAGDQKLKYKTRLETIKFRLTDRQYRFGEISLLDPAGKLIQTKAADASENWRPVKPGGITERLFNAAYAASPLGAWRVVAYRFAVDDSKGPKTTPELDRLVGVNVQLRIDLAAVGNRVCSSPSFADNDAAPEDSLRQLGIDWKLLGIKRENARTINVRCQGEGWQPPHSLLIKDSGARGEEMLMLWDGVFLVLKRNDGNEIHGTGLPSLKRRQPN